MAVKKGFRLLRVCSATIVVWAQCAALSNNFHVHITKEYRKSGTCNLGIFPTSQTESAKQRVVQQLGKQRLVQLCTFIIYKYVSKKGVGEGVGKYCGHPTATNKSKQNSVIKMSQVQLKYFQQLAFLYNFQHNLEQNIWQQLSRRAKSRREEQTARKIYLRYIVKIKKFEIIYSFS